VDRELDYGAIILTLANRENSSQIAMQKTIIVLIVIAVAAIFFWQFFRPAPSPAEQINLEMAESS
jgi:hypothetical protein